MRRSILIIPVMLFVLAGSVFAQDLKKGLAAYKRGDYKTAIEQWRPLAEAGHAGAQYNLGFNYVQGKGVPKDLVQAYFWFDLAARQNRGIAKQLRDGIGKKMTKDQIAAAHLLVEAWIADRKKAKPRKVRPN